MRYHYKKIIFTGIFLLLVIFCGHSQNYTLNITVNGTPNNLSALSEKKIYITSIYGHYQTVIDSAVLNITGTSRKVGEAQFHLRNARAGMYRIILGQTQEAAFYNEAPQSFNMIIPVAPVIPEGLDQREKASSLQISLSTSFEYPLDSMEVKGSKENEQYYNYLKKKKLYNQKLDVLEQMLRLYPKNDEAKILKTNDRFYLKIQKQYNQLQKELIAYSNRLIKQYPAAFFTKIVMLEQYPFIEATITEEERLLTLKKQFFKPSDFQDTLLLYSDALSNKIITYLGLYRNPNYTEEQQTNEFIKAADQLLTALKYGTGIASSPQGNEGVGLYILKYVIEGFNQIKQDAVLAYITDNFLSENTCREDGKINQIIQKTADYKRTAIGAIAPEIKFDAKAFSTIQTFGFPLNKLSDISGDYTLLLFWASWCPHCTNMLPELKHIYDKNKQKGFQVLAISLDEDSLQLSKFIANGNYNWLNYSELKKWESPTARAYNVKATPMMFLLDKDKKIISKPETIQQLINELGLINPTH